MHLDRVLKRARHFITLKELYSDIWLLLSVLENHRNWTAGLTIVLCDIPLCHHAILFILSNLSMILSWTVFIVISSASIYGNQLQAWVYFFSHVVFILFALLLWVNRITHKLQLVPYFVCFRLRIVGKSVDYEFIPELDWPWHVFTNEPWRRQQYSRFHVSFIFKHLS